MPIAAEAPSLLNPLDWLKAKLQDFFTLPARITALQQRGSKLADIAAQRNRSDLADQVRQATSNLSTTQTMQQAVQGKLSSLFGELGKLGVKLPGMSGYPAGSSELGVIPLVVLALGGAVAVAIYAVFRHYNTQEQVITSVEQGLLSPEEAKSLLGGLSFNLGGALSPLVWLAGLGLAAYFLLPKLLKRARG